MFKFILAVVGRMKSFIVLGLAPWWVGCSNTEGCFIQAYPLGRQEKWQQEKGSLQGEVITTWNTVIDMTSITSAVLGSSGQSLGPAYTQGGGMHKGRHQERGQGGSSSKSAYHRKKGGPP